MKNGEFIFSMRSCRWQYCTFDRKSTLEGETSLPVLRRSDAKADMAAGVEKSTKERLLSVLDDLEVLSR